MWVYVVGERDGGAVTIGETDVPLIADLERGHVLLAAVRSSGAVFANQYFVDHPDELVEWVLWLRQQWFVGFDEESLAHIQDVDPAEWLPNAKRREPPPLVDPDKLIQDSTQLQGPLAGTAWDWLPDLKLSFQDYFTPPELVAAAAEAMGGIDLDAASHWIANRRLHEAHVYIGDYFHRNKSAFTHDWSDRVWLNPPYGENDLWFKRVLEMMDSGLTTQLCMLSPVYAFTTRVARAVMQRSAATVLLVPTPSFYNPSDANKTGTNLPHAVFYWGERRDEFLRAYCPEFGIPFTLAWDAIEAVV